jgi:uncharacterized RDD family membrane protein YckC
MPCAIHPATFDNLSRCSACGGMFCRQCIPNPSPYASCPRCRDNPYAQPGAARVQAPDLASQAPSNLELGGQGARFVAQIIDNVILIVVLVVIMIAAVAVTIAAHPPHGQGGSPPDPAAMVLILLAVLGWVAGVVCYEALMLINYGQTLGKMAMNVVVVRKDGSPLTRGQAWGRVFSRIALGMIPYSLGTILDSLFIFSEERTCLHDRMAGTIVVTKDSLRR